MSRIDNDGDYAEYNNAAELWRANLNRALKGKRGRKALAELREALHALPEKRLVSGALCTAERDDDERDRWGDFDRLMSSEGAGVCTVGAFAWWQRVKGGMSHEEAFRSLPLAPDYDDGSFQTEEEGARAGLTRVLTWHLMYLNDDQHDSMTPEQRWQAVVDWIDGELAAVPA